MTQSGQQGGLDRVYMVQPNRAKGRAGILNFGARDSFATGPTTIGKAKAVALAMVADAGMGKVLNASTFSGQSHYFGRQEIVLHEKCPVRFQHVHEEV